MLIRQMRSIQLDIFDVYYIIEFSGKKNKEELSIKQRQTDKPKTDKPTNRHTYTRTSRQRNTQIKRQTDKRTHHRLEKCESRERFKIGRRQYIGKMFNKQISEKVTQIVCEFTVVLIFVVFIHLNVQEYLQKCLLLFI